MFENIPKRWNIFSLNGLATIITGNTPPKNHSEYYETEDILWVKPSDLSEWNPWLWETEEKLSENARKVIRILPVNSVLVSCIGTIGKIGIAPVELATNQQINSVIFNDKIINFKYGYYAFKYYKERLANLASNAVVPIINKTQFSTFKIPVPPTLEEQQEIVDVLDAASEIIRLRTACIESAQDLIPALFQEMFKPYANYTKTALNNLFEFKSGGTPSKQVEEYFQGDIPWITTVALNKLFIGKEDANELITEEAIQKSATKLIPANSLLFGTRVGIGKLAINTVPMCTNQDIVAMIPFENNNLNLVYAYWYLKQINNFFVANGRGATIQGITTHLVRSTEIILPPLKVQEQFAQKVIEIESYIKEQQEELENAKQMFQSLLHHAFTGELTNNKPQGDTLEK